MKFSVNWLREFVEAPADSAQLADVLTMAGVEIEGIEGRGADFKNVVIAQITDSKPHPNADRLSVCAVNDGSGKTRQIVCGAKNYKVGDKVPLALPGAILPNDLKIRASKLRGVESEGMLCSAKELALSDESAGLLILSPEAKIGAPISTVFPADTIFDVEITPNRGDLLNHLGLAREIAALLGKPLPSPNFLSNQEPLGTQSAGVTISAPRECPFYSARKIDNVAIGAAPDWIRARIEACGIRSISNIVDITNFVMLELGQPLHAFDADKLQGEINVRLAKPGEKFIALDGKTYSLGIDNLVIADQVHAVALAGVMGGEDTGVTASTRNLLLESAYFLPASVRRTARRLNLPSDASYRFERGVDPKMILRASDRATELIRELADGRPAANISTAGALPPPPLDVTLRYGRCQEILGLAIESKTIDQILEGFGLQKAKATKEKTVWKIPSYRRDLPREIDLIEEVVRRDGLARIPSSDRSRFTASSEADRDYDFESQLRGRLVALGVSEARTSALLPRSGQADVALELRNPLSEDHVALRPSLIPGLLATLARNLRAGAATIRLFELGRVFAPNDGRETRRVALVFCGKTKASAHWRNFDKRSLDFFDAKGALEAVAATNLSFRRAQRDDLALAAEVLLDEKVIGFLGRLPAARAAEMGASDPVFVAEIELAPLRLTKQRKNFRELEKFPSITRDIAMLVPEKISHAEILTAIKSADEPLLTNVELFDLFSGKEAETLAANRKSLAYSLTYRDKNRTLTNDEVALVHARIRERLQRELGAELRE